MTWETNPLSCPICNCSDMVFPSGPKKSPILVVGDEPGSDELLQGHPFAGETGYILMQELGLCGLDFKQMRATNLWLHSANPKSEFHLKCLEYCSSKVIEEAANKKIILLIGSDTVKYFCRKSVKDFNGLVVKSDYFSAPCLISIQPTMVFKSTVGEVRFAIRQFAKYIEENKIL